MTERTPSDSAAASRIWTAMQAFVTSQDRSGALRETLNLGPVKIELLIRLIEGPMTLKEIARAIGVDPSAATVTVDKLEGRGLVHRTAHPDDNRRKLVRLTEVGRNAAAHGWRIITEPPATLLKLPAEDLERLDEILARLGSAAGDGTAL
jgi:DNA-binding MarR family transcriptional regulator